jgi:hypothetical protein|tara:strand:- start:3523 stop:3891 length:369 start_codon:yes stop_codon:yes gene_type:complete
MLITKDNLKDLKIGQQVYEAYWGFKMIKRTIYVGIHDTLPPLDDTSEPGWLQHCFFDKSNSFTISINLNKSDQRHLPEKIRNKVLFTEYEEACVKSRELALECIVHYNSHDFKNNPITIKKK